jgi:hypothetical protein
MDKICTSYISNQSYMNMQINIKIKHEYAHKHTYTHITISSYSNNLNRLIVGHNQINLLISYLKSSIRNYI